MKRITNEYTVIAHLLKVRITLDCGHETVYSTKCKGCPVPKMDEEADCWHCEDQLKGKPDGEESE